MILNASAIARPGDIIGLQGDGFGNGATVWCATNGGAPLQLPLVNSGNGQLHVQLPPTLGLYSLTVKNGTNSSNPAYPNRANPMHFDTPEVSPGGEFRIFGRNLCIGPRAPVVTFVEGAASYPATVKAKRTYDTLSVIAPSNIPLGTATIQVSNGYGPASIATASCPEPMVIRASGPDTFTLGVPWAEGMAFGANVYNVKTDSRLTIHAVGDGATNDQPALQAAISAAGAAGGGVVYLPAGTYALKGTSGPQMTMASNVVVQGAGRDKSTLAYGFGTPGSNFWIAYFDGLSQSGICDLSIVNKNQGGLWVGANTLHTIGGDFPPSAPTSRVFLARVNAKFLTSQRVQFMYMDRVAVVNCNLSIRDSLVFVMGSTNFTIRDSTLTQLGGVNIDATYTDYGVIENNKIVLDGNLGAANNDEIRHGIPFAFSNNVAILNNTFSAINGPVGYNNDTEELINEGGAGDRSGEEVGNITSASGTSTTVSGSATYDPDTVIEIINGRGLGQWRWIAARNGSTITTNSPWLVNPDSTSTYAMSRMTSNTTVDGNSFGGYLRGIWIYQGNTSDLEIANNTFGPGVDGVLLQPNQMSSLNQFIPVWNTQVWNNTLTGNQNFGSFFSLTSDYVDGPSLLGVMAINDEFRDNFYISGNAGFFGGVPPWAESYADFLRLEGGATYTNNGIPGSLGTIFQGNTATNCENQAFIIDTGACQTVIADSKANNVASFVNDSPVTNATHASVNTVYLRTTGTLPTSPTAISAKPANGEVVLTWAAVHNVASYDVYRGTSPGNESGTAIANVAAPGYVDTSAANGIKYYYYVTAINWNGHSGTSSEASAMPQANLTAPSSVPGAVTGLTLNVVDNAAVLRWDPVFAVPPVQNYYVSRATTPGGETNPYPGLGASQTTFDDESTSPYTTYYYTVRAANSVGNGPPSSEGSAMVYSQPVSPPAAPTMLNATPGNGRITLTWNASAGASSYVLYRSTTSGMAGWVSIQGTFLGRSYPTVNNITALSYIDTGLTNDTTYYYTVAARGAIGVSWVLSPQAAATPRVNSALQTPKAPGSPAGRVNAG